MMLKTSSLLSLSLLTLFSSSASASASAAIRKAERIVLADLDAALAPPNAAKTATPSPLVNIEVNVPPRVLPTSQQLRKCSANLLTRSFANSYGNPSIIPWSPSLFNDKACADPANWHSLVLTQQGASRGRQFDRLGSVSIGNTQSNGPVEIWRTDNAEPTLTGITWSTRKDISQYYSLFKQAQSTIVFDYPNIVDDTYTGALNITLSIQAYVPVTTTSSTAPVQRDAIDPADQVPMHAERHPADAAPHHSILTARRRASQQDDHHKRLNIGFPSTPLFSRTPDRIYALSGNKPVSQPPLSLIGNGVTSPATSQILTTMLSSFPVNPARALVEIYASGTAQDEFWYTNVPSSLAEQVEGAADLGLYGGGPYREVQLRIDGVLAGIVSPYAVIFTGGIQPLMWRPLAAYGAYNQPTYFIDITPFLGTLTDSKPHTFELAVQSADRNGSYPQGWFLSGNVQVVLDFTSARTTGQLIYTTPTSASLPYPTLTTTGKITGDLTSSNGSLFATVGTRRGQPRQMSVVGEVRTGSMKAGAAVRYAWRQKFDYRADLVLNATVSTSKQTSGNSTLTASTPPPSKNNPAQDGTNPLPLYAQSFSFPLLTTSAYDGTLNGSVSHSYRTSTTSLDSLFGGGGGRKLGLAAAVEVEVTQEASAWSNLSGSGVSGGAGQSKETYSYKDSNLFTFERSIAASNRTILYDDISGTLASQAEPSR
ncbi:hypothetical protein V8E36_008864 [Tilletia maclaganii]